jgi:hypothetical protein
LLDGGVYLESISECAEFPTWNDPRAKIQPRTAPLIQVQMEGDFPEAFNTRRPDSDEPGDRYRLYEIAGASHDGAGGGATEPDSRCVPRVASNQPMASYSLRSALANLELWVRNGTSPPRAARLKSKSIGLQKPTGERDRFGYGLGARRAEYEIVRDQYGNALGGARSPYVDVPIAGYHGRLGGLPCEILGANGWNEPFDKTRLTSLYGDAKSYGAKLQQAVDRAVKERWLTAADATKVQAELTPVQNFP